MIAGIPVQIIPATNEIAEEAITTAAELDYEGQPVRVIRPEYLIALYLEPSARSAKRLERVAALLEQDDVDPIARRQERAPFPPWKSLAS